MMSTHQATEQMLGYLYQVRYALWLLLNNDNENHQISIEQFDDVAFTEGNTPVQMIQLKHHIRQQGNLSDASTDIWRTLKVWIDAISKNESLLNDTDFLIITTANAPEDSAASLLKSNNRNVDLAYQKLKQVVSQSNNREHQNYYKAFSAVDELLMKKLLGKVYVVDGACNIIDIGHDLRKWIRYSCVPKYESQILERIEGWWYQRAIEALCSATPIFCAQKQIRSFIVSTSQQYTEDNLPIDVWLDNSITRDNLGFDQKIFYEQLKLICLSNHRLKIAIKDYYRAFKQRANWVRNDLLYVNELETYERHLIDEWEHHFASMEDELSMIGLSTTEDDKVKYGKKLFEKIEDKDIRIRPKVQDAFIMRGSYHILANQLKIGWHIDFQERLKQILSVEEGGMIHEDLE